MAERICLLEADFVTFLDYETETMAYTEHLFGLVRRIWRLTPKKVG